MTSFKFTIRHGFVASLVLHAAILMPFALPLGAAESEEDDTLVFNMEGFLSDDQSDEKTLQQTAQTAGRDESKPERTQVAQAAEQHQTDVISDISESTSTNSAKQSARRVKTPGAPEDSAETSGGDQQQNAQTRRLEQEVDEGRALRAYVKALSKRVQSKLVYPEEGRQTGWQGVTTVTFTILPNGSIRPDSLKVVSNSGQPKLDESALRTIRACAPFVPPPKETTLTIGVDYGRKR